MRPFAIFASGLLVGLAIQSGSAQQRDFLALNHVEISVDNFDAASKFYAETMGLPVAFSFNEPDGSPYLSKSWSSDPNHSTGR